MTDLSSLTPLSTHTREIPIEHGTVINPNASRHPPPMLTNALDSLASFPSIQRFQQKRTSNNIDQNSNHLRSIHDRHETNARFLKIDHKLSKSEDMLRAKYHVQLEPSERALMGTTVASYLDTFHPEYQLQQQSQSIVPNGVVSQHRNYFSQQTAIPANAEFDSSSQKRKFSKKNDNTMKVESRESDSSGSGDYPQQISKFNPTRRQSAPHGSEHPKVTITGVTAVDPVTSELPTSFYLLRQSQESLILKRKPRAASSDAPSERSPSYRTIIKFSKNREIVADSERPIPHAVLRHGEAISPSTTTVERTSPQHVQQRDSSTPDLLRVRFSPEVREQRELSPTVIRQQCDEIYRIVQHHGYQAGVYSDGPESGYNTLKEAPPLTRMHSNGSIGKSPPPGYGGGLPPMQHPLQVDFSPPEPYKPNQKIHEIENKEAEIERLQRELYDAQVCNYRLNSQMGQLVSKDWKREESELKKSLKDKTAEIDTLKKKLEKAERDRRNLESKQPPNVQALQGEKRELQIALEREESEKHELFMQINQLIAELADLRGNAASNAEAKELKEEIDQLRGKLQTAEHERDEIRRSLSNLEAAKTSAQDEVFTLKNELEKVKATAETEKQRLRQEIAETQKEVQVKSAALQSLRLAKSEPSTSTEDYDRVVQEKAQLARELEAKKKELAEMASRGENDKQKAVEISEAKIKSLEKDLEEFRQNLERAQAELSQKTEEMEDYRSQFVSASSSASAQTHELQEKLENAYRKIAQLEQSLDLTAKNSSEIESEAADLEERLAQAEDTIDQLNSELVALKENGKSDELRISSELQIAKEAVANREKEVESERKKVKEAEEQIKKLREEVDNHKNEAVTLNEDLQKRSTEISQTHATIAELQTRITQLEKENNKLMEKASVEEELMTLVNSLQEARTRITAKEAEVHELRQKLIEQQDETDKVASELRQTLSALERAEEECKKLAETDVELAEYRRESEKKLEDVRRELNEEILKAKSETNKIQAELESTKKTVAKLEMELKDMANLGEARLEKLRTAEMEKTRLETKVVEYESEVETLQEDLTRLRQNQSETAESGEKELQKVQEALRTTEANLKASSAEKDNLEVEIEEIKARETAHTRDIVNLKEEIANLSTQLVKAREDKDSLQSDLDAAHHRFNGTESSKDSEITQLRKDLREKEDELKQLATTALELDVVRSSLNDLHSKMGVMEQDKTTLANNLQEAKNALARKEEELAAEQQASVSKLGSREAELKQDLEKMKREKETLEAEIANQKQHIADLKQSHDKLNENLQRLTELLSADGKRFDSISKEKEALAEEKHLLAENLRRSEDQIKRLENEIDELKATVHTPPLGDDAELRRKISELTEENARLAGDLLKQSGNDDASHLRQEFEKAMYDKQRAWQSEKQSLLHRLEEQENDIQKLNQAKVDLETDLQRMKIASYSDTMTPVPKPRRANTSLTNLTMDTYSERSITPSADEEEVRKLRTELDKQKRIVTVLRKKLQQQQVETLRQNKVHSSMALS